MQHYRCGYSNGVRRTESFISSLEPVETLDRFEDLSKTKGCKMEFRNDGARIAEAKQGFTILSWGQHIKVFAKETPTGTEARVVVDNFQLFDWGQASRIKRELRNRLGGQP
jgi:hypothetical protein